MNTKCYMKKTLAYYSKWLGEDGILSQTFDGIKYVYQQERNKVQYGYGQPFDIYIFVMADKIIVSYGDKAKPQIGALRDCVGDFVTIEDLKSALKTIYGKDVVHNVKYVFNGKKTDDCSARLLDKYDYEAYENFYIKCNPNCSDLDWLQAYFEEMICGKLCSGAYEGSILVSCADAPGMPYMSDEVQEIGINTLPDYRGKGYATIACQSSINEMLKNGKVPQWSTSTTNIASQKLAEKLGFVRLGDVITLTI